MKSKRGQLWQTLIPWIIAIATGVLIFILYIILRHGLGGAGELLKNLLRFGR